jgi:hypothetical protein
MRVGILTLLVLSGAIVAGCGDDSTGPSGREPVVAAVLPDSGTVGTRVEITGSSFEAGLTVRFGPFPATGITLVSSTTVLAHAPDSVRVGVDYDVVVTNPGGRTSTLAGAYRAVPPNLQVVNGVSRPSGQRGSTIIFEGKAFGDLLGKGSLWFTDDGGLPVAAEVMSQDNWTDEFIVAAVPQSAASGPVWIETPTGISRTVSFKLAEGAVFSPSLISWTETTALPDGSQGHRAVFLSGEDDGQDHMVCVTGGADGALVPRAVVWYSSVEETGAIQPWSTAGSLPDGRAFHGMVAATPFNALIDTTVAAHFYVLGGIDATGNPTSTVYSAPVYPDRTIGSWMVESPLPEPLHAMGVAVFRSWLFVVGGATTGNAPVSRVYRARILTDGSLDAWESQPSLPEPRAYGALIHFADMLYLVAGDAGSVEPGSAAVSQTQTGDILHNRLDLRTAELEGAVWSLNSGSLIKSVAKHTALVAGGTVLVSGGVYNGAGNSATEHQYASIELDGEVGSFNGATGSQTIAGSSGAGGEPFFNHAAIVYVDLTGEAHVVMIGGNDINDPASPLGSTYYY